MSSLMSNFVIIAVGPLRLIFRVAASIHGLAVIIVVSSQVLDPDLERAKQVSEPNPNAKTHMSLRWAFTTK